MNEINADILTDFIKHKGLVMQEMFLFDVIILIFSTIPIEVIINPINLLRLSDTYML